MDPEELKECDFCLKQIMQSKFRLHSVQCRRHNTKCEQCGKVILKTEMKAHEAADHSEPAAMKEEVGKVREANESVIHHNDLAIPHERNSSGNISEEIKVSSH